MLKQDFNGYKEFVEKVLKAKGEDKENVCIERIQMWTDKFTDIINPLPGGDAALVIVALESTARAIRKDCIEADKLADFFEMKIGMECRMKTIKGGINMTEAAAREYAKMLKNK